MANPAPVKAVCSEPCWGSILSHQGRFTFEEKPLTPLSVQAIRSCTAYIGQEPVLGAEKVKEALLLPFQFKAHRAHRPTEAQLFEVLQRLQLPADILRQDSSHISGGEKQRIALARGLLLGKKVYLLDEVTSALDAESKQAVFEVFSDPTLTVLSVAHDPEWLEQCDRVFELDAGRLTAGEAACKHLILSYRGWRCFTASVCCRAYCSG